jgi:hypothetical protein
MDTIPLSLNQLTTINFGLWFWKKCGQKFTVVTWSLKEDGKLMFGKLWLKLQSTNSIIPALMLSLYSNKLLNYWIINGLLVLPLLVILKKIWFKDMLIQFLELITSLMKMELEFCWLNGKFLYYQISLLFLLIFKRIQ